MVLVLLEECCTNDIQAMNIWSAITTLLPAITALLGGLVGHWLTIARLRKIGAEATLKNGEILDRLEYQGSQLSAKRETFTLLLEEFRDALKPKRKRKLKETRDEICRLHSEEYLETLRLFVENCRICLNRSSFRDRVRTDVLPALKVTLRFLKVINHEEVLNTLNHAAPYKLDPIAYETLVKRITSRLPLLDRETRRQIKEVQERSRAYFREKLYEI